MKLVFLQKLIISIFGKQLSAIWAFKKRPMEIWVFFSNIKWHPVDFVKKNTFLQAVTLNDVCIVDWVSRKFRFEVIYNMFSYAYAFRFFLKCYVVEENNFNTVFKYCKSCWWLEREAWDMFGVFFSGNPDLRRLLTDYGFEGYPLRKDFPLTGYLEIRFDDEKGSLVYEPVELAQDYRNFDFLSPWENIVI